MTDFRYAKADDIDLILEFINKHALTQGLPDPVTVTSEDLKKEIFERGNANVIFSLKDGKETGFAFFYYAFSSFVGKRILYLEDLYVLPEYRGQGFGKKLMLTLVSIAREKNCVKMEWCCLKKNEASAAFYRSLGAIESDDRCLFKLYI